jgi:hypothetical protein
MDAQAYRVARRPALRQDTNWRTWRGRPEPAAAAPDLRAAWHEAFAAPAPVDGPDGLPDGRLLHLRDTYP